MDKGKPESGVGGGSWENQRSPQRVKILNRIISSESVCCVLWREENTISCCPNLDPLVIDPFSARDSYCSLASCPWHWAGLSACLGIQVAGSSFWLSLAVIWVLGKVIFLAPSLGTKGSYSTMITTAGDTYNDHYLLKRTEAS